MTNPYPLVREKKVERKTRARRADHPTRLVRVARPRLLNTSGHHPEAEVIEVERHRKVGVTAPVQVVPQMDLGNLTRDIQLSHFSCATPRVRTARRYDSRRGR